MHCEDACLFVFVVVGGGSSAVAGSSGTVGGGRGDGNLLLVVDKTMVVKSRRSRRRVAMLVYRDPSGDEKRGREQVDSLFVVDGGHGVLMRICIRDERSTENRDESSVVGLAGDADNDDDGGDEQRL